MTVPPTRTRMHSSVAVWASKKSARLIVLSVVVAVWAMIGSTDAFATHFRYGNLTWAPAASPANSVNFTLTAAWRRDYPWPPGGGSPITCINTVTTTAVPCTGPGGLPGVGNVVWEPNGEISPGQGANINVGALYGSGLLYRVTSIDIPNNWLFGIAL